MPVLSTMPALLLRGNAHLTNFALRQQHRLYHKKRSPDDDTGQRRTGSCADENVDERAKLPKCIGILAGRKHDESPIGILAGRRKYDESPLWLVGLGAALLLLLTLSCSIQGCLSGADVIESKEQLSLDEIESDLMTLNMKAFPYWASAAAVVVNSEKLHWLNTVVKPALVELACVALCHSLAVHVFSKIIFSVGRIRWLSLGRRILLPSTSRRFSRNLLAARRSSGGGGGGGGGNRWLKSFTSMLSKTRVSKVVNRARRVVNHILSNDDINTEDVLALFLGKQDNVGEGENRP